MHTLFGPFDRIRTCDHRNRNPVLYPAELRTVIKFTTNYIIDFRKSKEIFFNLSRITTIIVQSRQNYLKFIFGKYSHKCRITIGVLHHEKRIAIESQNITVK